MEKRKLKTLLKEKLNGLISEDLKIELDSPKDLSHGDYSTNIALKLAGKKKSNPLDEARKLLGLINESEIDGMDKIEVVRPGFINFFVSNKKLTESLKTITTNNNFGLGKDLEGKKIMVEFAHPNPFKAFHIGHLRNIMLGESIVRLLESQKAKVIRVNYQGDVGMHIAKCIWALKKVDSRNYPGTADERVALLGKCYVQGALAFKEDEKSEKEIKEINKKIYSLKDTEIKRLWELGKKWSLDKFNEIYKRLYTTFEREYMESETLEIATAEIKKAIDSGILVESEGAIVFDGSKHGLDTRVFLNNEGLPTYEGKELGLAKMEFTDFGDIDLCIHNVAVEQISFFKVTFKVQELLEPSLYKGKQYHNAYEFVGLKKGKMSSRTGNVILGNDILNQANEKISKIIQARDAVLENEAIEEIAIGAVKWSFLNISPFTYLAFDLDESVSFEGNSGPYIQYSNARAKSIINKLQLQSGSINKLTDEEKDLVRTFIKFPDVVSKATKDYSPHYITDYLYRISQEYNKFYSKNKIIGSGEHEYKRLLITKSFSNILTKGLSLLGIKSPDKM